MNARPVVLLVDDDVDTREMYSISLETRGFDVYGAGSTASAMAVADAHHVDVVVTDFTLPGEDGFVLASRLRSAPARAELPIVLVSGRAFVGGSGERALELFDRILLKPVLPDDLIGEVVPLLLDRRTARLERQLTAVCERVRVIPTGSGVGRVLTAVAEVSGSEAPPAALVADGLARYIAANDAACLLTGRSHAELLASSVWDLTSPGGLADGRRQWEQFVAGGTVTGAYRITMPHGAGVDATFAASAHVLPGCHLSLLRAVPAALILDGSAV